MTSQHLVPCSRVIRFLYQPAVAQRTVRVIPRPQKMHATTQPKATPRTPPSERARGSRLLNMVSVQLRRHGPNGGNRIQPTPSLRLAKSASPNTAEESKCTGRLIAPFSESPTRHLPEPSQQGEVEGRGTLAPPTHISVVSTPASCGFFTACFEPMTETDYLVDITQLNHSSMRHCRQRIFSGVEPSRPGRETQALQAEVAAK